MKIKLDHTVVYARDHNQAANEFADVMNLPLGRMAGTDYDFSVVQINNELSVYFMNRDEGSLEQHMAFYVDGRLFEIMTNSY